MPLRHFHCEDTKGDAWEDIHIDGTEEDAVKVFCDRYKVPRKRVQVQEVLIPDGGSSPA